MFNNIDEVLPQVIGEVIAEAERFQKACEMYLNRLTFIIDGYRRKLLEKKGKVVVPLPPVVNGPKKKFRILSLDGT